MECHWPLETSQGKFLYQYFPYDAKSFTSQSSPFIIYHYCLSEDTWKHVEKWNEKLCLFWLETCLKLDIQGVFISSWKARIENCMDFKLILHTKASLKFTLLWNLSRQYSILYLPMTGITYGLVNEWEHSCLHKLMDSSLTCMVLLSK